MGLSGDSSCPAYPPGKTASEFPNNKRANATAQSFLASFLNVIPIKYSLYNTHLNICKAVV